MLHTSSLAITPSTKIISKDIIHEVHSIQSFDIKAEDGQVNAFIIFLENMKQGVSLYTELTGSTPLPPKWALG